MQDLPKISKHGLLITLGRFSEHTTYLLGVGMGGGGWGFVECFATSTFLYNYFTSYSFILYYDKRTVLVNT